MATIARGTKSATGTTNFQESGASPALASEVNTDFNTIYTEFNGAISADNLATGAVTSIKIAAGVDAAKIDDHSDTVTIMANTTDPGVSGSESQATTLEGEIQRERYMLHSIGHGVDLYHYNGTSTATIYWGDRTVRGPNLVRNGSFEVKTTGSTSAPDGWTTVGTPTTCSQATTDVTNGTGKALRIVADAASEGISQTFAGLKAGRHYAFQVRYKVSVGSVVFTCTGADAATAFRSPTLTKTDTSWSTVGFVIATDSTPTDIVLKIQSAANLDDFQVDDVQFREMSRDIQWRPGGIIVRDSSTATGALSNVEGAFPTGDQLSCAVTVPGPGYSINVRSACRVKAGAAEDVTLQLYEDAASVDCAGVSLAAINYQSTLNLGYTNNSPTPGTTYTYTTTALASAASGTSNGTSNGKTTLSWLEVELIPPG